MRRTCILLILLSVAGFISACQNDGKGVTPTLNTTLLTGKWNLQQQKMVQYLDGVKKIDSTFTASSQSAAHLQFNKDGSFNSAGFTITGIATTGSLGGGITSVARDSTYGTYSLASSALKLSEHIAGISSGPFSFFSNTSVSVFTPVSYTVQVNQLTSSSLSLHAEYIATVTQNGITQTFKDDEDYNYIK